MYDSYLPLLSFCVHLFDLIPRFPFFIYCFFCLSNYISLKYVFFFLSLTTLSLVSFYSFDFLTCIFLCPFRSSSFFSYSLSFHFKLPSFCITLLDYLLFFSSTFSISSSTLPFCSFLPFQQVMSGSISPATLPATPHLSQHLSTFQIQ